MLVAAAVVPSAPLLVPDIAGASASLDEPLREQCTQAARTLLAAAPDVVVVVGSAASTARMAGRWDWRGFGLPARAPAGTALPLGPAIGDWLLDTVQWTGERELVGVARGEPADACAALGRRLVAGPRRVALLACADGTACRTEKAPGHLDPRAAEVDAGIAAALAAVDVAALLRLAPELMDALLVAGRGSWQVLAGAAAEGRWTGSLSWDEAPYGVGYFVSTWVAAP